MKKLFLLFVGLLLIQLGYAENTARVKFVIGLADRQTSGQTSWEKIKFNGKIYQGDRIRTRSNSNVELAMPDGSQIKIGENTMFEVTELKEPETDKEDKVTLTVWLGSIWAKFKKVVTNRQERFVDSPSAVVAIRGTTLEIDVDNTEKTLVRVTEGLVSVKSKQTSEEVMVGSNQQTIVEKGKAPTKPGKIQESTEEKDAEPSKEFKFSINLEKNRFTDPAVIGAGIPIKGRVTPGMQVTVNGSPVNVRPDGQFDTRLRVREGLNQYKVEARLGDDVRSRNVGVFVNTKKPEIRLSSPLVSGFINRRDYSLSGGVFDTTPGDKIKVRLNREMVGEIDGRGSFNRTVILKEGANKIIVEAEDMDGNHFEKTQDLFLDTVKPILTITEPAQPSLVRFEPPPPPNMPNQRYEQVVRGIIIDPEPSSKIKRISVNGQEIRPNSDGTFETIVFLKRGQNHLNFIVEDLAGNVFRDNSRTIRIPKI